MYVIITFWELNFGKSSEEMARLYFWTFYMYLQICMEPSVGKSDSHLVSFFLFNIT